MEIKLIWLMGESQLIHGLLPGTIVCRHGVVEHTIHVEYHRLQVEPMQPVPL